jgi:cbb3-type cytochrome oxidase maturation protein|tara:strand:- start:9184 stop:9342 length:159 start_codon:yes stop_codon:yes gene_type:complete
VEVLYLLIPIALGLVVLIGAAVVWAISSGQYDDLDRAAEDVLLDDDEPGPPP